MAGEPPGAKKRGRPRKIPTEDSPGSASTARSSLLAAVRRSGRQRRPRRARDFADYGDEDDDFYWWELSSDEDAGKNKAEDDLEPRKFRLLQKLPLQSDGSGGSGREEEEEIGGTDYTEECDEPASAPVFTPLPDKKTLESILDKLQKKDIYGVYAEPVDPDELPDYHDIIKHPVDFKTIRKKLADGCYTDLEKFESDVFLLCTNAMEYNAPDTIYFRQAHSIQELARKKFQSIRTTRKELTNSEGKNLTARQAEMAHASSGDVINDVIALPENVPQQPVSISGNMDGRLMNDNKFLKGEDYSVKNPPKIEGKSEAPNEDRRSTYPNHVDMEFSLFDHDQRHLVPVGLEGSQYSYARSLARFAGPLGPTIWKIVSRRIEQSLPPGVGFGPGWVGDYEPLHQGPYVLDMSENQKERSFMNDVSPSVRGRPLIMADRSGPRWLQKPTAPMQGDQIKKCERFGQTQVSQPTDARFGQMGYARSSTDYQTDLSHGSLGPTGQLGQILSRSGTGALAQEKFGQTHLDTKTLADARLGQIPVDIRVSQPLRGFGQNLIGNVNPVSHFDPRVFSGGRFGQNPSGNVNSVSNLDPRAFADGRFVQAPAARLTPSPHSSTFPSHPSMSHNQSTGPVNLTKSMAYTENLNLHMRGNAIDAVTTAAPTRMSIGRLPPPPRPDSNFQNMGLLVNGSTGEEQRGGQNKNLPGILQVHHDVFARQACWQGLTPHWQERKNESQAPDLNVDFQNPKLPVQQFPSICGDPPQPDLALQL